MSISKSYNKQNDTTYVYEVIENYWDKDKKQPRSKRKLIGKIDPATGEVVPTTPRKKKQEDNAEDYKKLYESVKKEIAQKDKHITELEGIITEWLIEGISFLQESEETMKRRRNKAESLLRKYSRHG